MGKWIEAGDQKVDEMVVDRLLRSAGPLHPRYLTAISSEYKFFGPLDKTALIFVKPEKGELLARLSGQCQSLIVSLSGVAASGKDTIRHWIEINQPGLIQKMVTATTRMPRPGEVHGRDLYFYSETDFLAELAAGNLIEHSVQSTGHYGLPVKSLFWALTNGRVAVSQMEMSGWPKLRAKVEALLTPAPLILSLFVLPQMSYKDYVAWWLPEHRPDIHREKALRAAWELSVAASNVDAFIINPINEKYQPGQIAGEAIVSLLTSLLT